MIAAEAFRTVHTPRTALVSDFNSSRHLHQQLYSVTSTALVSCINSSRQLHQQLSSVTSTALVSYINSSRQLHQQLSSVTSTALVSCINSSRQLHQQLSSVASTALVSYTNSSRQLHQQLSSVASTALVSCTNSSRQLHQRERSLHNFLLTESKAYTIIYNDGTARCPFSHRKPFTRGSFSLISENSRPTDVTSPQRIKASIVHCLDHSHSPPFTHCDGGSAFRITEREQYAGQHNARH